MLEHLWGYKKVAFFDAWTIEHFLSGVSIGTAVLLHNNRSLGEIFAMAKDKILHHKRIDFLKYKYDIIFILFLAYLWETLEHYLEAGLAGSRVEYWFQGVEYFPNRFLSDPLILVLGYLFAKRFPRTVWPARILSLVWLIVHVFIFPHSMYLQKWL